MLIIYADRPGIKRALDRVLAAQGDALFQDDRMTLRSEAESLDADDPTGCYLQFRRIRNVKLVKGRIIYGPEWDAVAEKHYVHAEFSIRKVRRAMGAGGRKGKHHGKHQQAQPRGA